MKASLCSKIGLALLAVFTVVFLANSRQRLGVHWCVAKQAVLFASTGKTAGGFSTNQQIDRCLAKTAKAKLANVNVQASPTNLLSPTTNVSQSESALGHTTCKWPKFRNFPLSADGYVARPSTKSKKILYVKTPKSGSTTVSCLLRKFGARRHMRILYPENRYNFENYQSMKRAKQQQQLSGVDMMVSHLIYRERDVVSVLGSKANAVFRISSVRDPESRTISSYLYARYLDARSREGDFVCSGLSHDYLLWVQHCPADSQVEYMRPKEWPKYTAEATFVHYDHVFVTERMIESILTLAPKLNFELNDILVVSMKTDTRGEIEKELTTDQSQELQRLVHAREMRNKVDREFLRLANNKLDEELAALPQSVRDAVEDLKVMSVDLQQFCASRSLERPLYMKCVADFIATQVDCVAS